MSIYVQKMLKIDKKALPIDTICGKEAAMRMV
jgi:hypothetical protein